MSKRIPLIETVNGSHIKCYDNGGKTVDRYTVVYIDRADWGYMEKFMVGLYPCVAMSASPYWPQGVCMHGECVIGRHLGRRIVFDNLPADCQAVVMNDTTQI